MSGKVFRGVKYKSPPSTFISLHFNKADEDQIEISYSDVKKSKEDLNSDACNASQSNLKSTNQTLESTYDGSSSIKDDANNDSFFKSYLSPKKASSFSLSEGIEDSAKHINKFADIITDNSTKNSTGAGIKSNQGTQFTNTFIKDEIDFNVTATKTVTNDSYNNLFKLSPAIEAAELRDENIFDNYINDELAKAKCEILDPKQQISSSFTTPQSKLSFLVTPSAKTDLELTPTKSQNSGVIHKLPQVTEGSTLLSVIKRCSDFANFARNSVPFHIFIAIFACLFAPIPPWVSGFFVGSILSSCMLYWLFPQKSGKSYLNYNFLEIQNVETEDNKNDSGIFKGWMNELPSFMSYNPEKYHVSCTRSVYVRLDGSYLRFSFPPKNIPKRAMFNEPRHELQFIYQQHYDITGATVELLPKGLASKRLWSKKYPICLRIPNSKDAVLSNSYKQDTWDGSFSSKLAPKKDNGNKKFASRINDKNEVIIYLFSRTDRDKNVWYRRFLTASKMKAPRSHSPSSTTEIDSMLENKRTLSVDFATLQFSSTEPNKQSMFYEDNDEVDSFVEINMSKQQKFDIYMSSLLAPLQSDNPYSLSMLKKKRDTSEKKSPKSSTYQSSNLIWLNALMGRIFFDFLVEDVWALLVTEKIQRKLNKLKLPFFLNELSVREIHLGSALPKIHRASDPLEDERGLWVDADLSYNGSFHMTLETKLKLKGDDSEELWSPTSEQSETTDHSFKSPVYNSDEEDSAESSSDEDVTLPDESAVDSSEESIIAIGGGSSTGRKILKFVDRLAQSQYFQTATRNKYVRRAMEDLSNMPLVLTVEVQWLTGTLALNIPPWPTDRLWYGFRSNPSLSLMARPMLGQKVVTLTHVTEWIEKKLVSEFQKLLVMPNMDDLIIPIMQPQHTDISSEESL